MLKNIPNTKGNTGYVYLWHVYISHFQGCCVMQLHLFNLCLSNNLHSLLLFGAFEFKIFTNGSVATLSLWSSLIICHIIGYIGWQQKPNTTKSIFNLDMLSVILGGSHLALRLATKNTISLDHSSTSTFVNHL